MKTLVGRHGGILVAVVVWLAALVPAAWAVAPVANDDWYTSGINGFLDVPAPGVLANDTDGDDDNLAAQRVDGPYNGTLDFDADGSFTYEPYADFEGTDSFTYMASDGEEFSTEATVYITVESRVWHVNAARAGQPDQDGLSWETALADLQDALTRATTDDEIWVAAGTYRPTAGTDRHASFVLPEYVYLYGGFAGGECHERDRDPRLHPTILSGDIGDPGFADNSYHVVTVGMGYDGGYVAARRACGDDYDWELDGFIVEGGNADGGEYPEDVGGGILVVCDHGLVRDTIVRDNRAARGAGVYQSAYDVDYINLIFHANVASDTGAAFDIGYVYEDYAYLANCTVYGNTAGTDGYALSGTSSTYVYNSIVWGNTPLGLDPVLNVYSSDLQELPEVEVVEGDGGSDANISDDPLFADAANGDFRLRPGSPCIDRGNGDEAAHKDIFGRRRVDDPNTCNEGVGYPDYTDLGALEHQPDLWACFMLYPGWNLLSLPFPVAETDTRRLFGAGTWAFRWNAAAQDYEYIAAHVALEGFYLWNSTAMRTVYLNTWELPDCAERALPAEWNLLGVDLPTFVDSDPTAVAAYLYDPHLADYVLLAIGGGFDMFPGVGYWLYLGEPVLFGCDDCGDDED